MTDYTREDYERAGQEMEDHANRAGAGATSDIRRWAALLTAAAERMTWRPIAEAPQDGTPILTYLGGEATIIAWMTPAEMYGAPDPEMGSFTEDDHRGQWWEWFGAPVESEPPCWLPLPHAPKTEGAE